MARSREEIISEMVDSGLFTDDEIRREVAQAKPSMGDRVGSFAKGAANLATMPGRGFRGLAVGASALMPKNPLMAALNPLASSRAILNPQTASNALLRAAEATKIGFKPSGFRETVASTIGESIPLAPLAGPMATGGKLAQLGKAALAGSGVSALTQTAEEGRPTIGRTAAAGALTAAPVAGLQLAQKVFPSVAAGFTKTVPEAYRGLTTKFKKQFPGTAEAIKSTASRASKVLEETFDNLSEAINAKKKFLGMEMTPKEAMREAASTGGDPRSISRIVREFQEIQSKSAPILEKEVKSGLLGPRGEELVRVIKEKGITIGEKLRRLDDMMMDINKATEGSYTTPVFQTKGAIKKEAGKIGQSSYAVLNKLKQKWGQLKQIEDDMGSILSNDETLGRDLENIVRKSIVSNEKMNGRDLLKLSAVQRLEEMTGKPIIEPLRNQIVSSLTNRELSDFVPRGMLGKILLMKYWPEGLTSFALGSPKTMGGVAQALYNPPGVKRAVERTVRPVISSAIAKKLTEKEKK